MSAPHIEVRGLTMAYGDRLIQKDLDFRVERGGRFVIMGPSGCGKSTLLKHMIGLLEPAAGQVVVDGTDLWSLDPEARRERARRFGVLYQSGALWSSMSVAQNVALPLAQYTDLPQERIDELVEFKLALVGLAGFGHYAPQALSGGMRKRAGLARAMALDPEVLYLDEPSAGLDPVSSRLLDDLILEINASLGTTFVMVTHELPSLFAVGTDAIYLDPETRTLLDQGAPRDLAERSPHEPVRRFLSRGAAPTGVPS